MFQEGAVKILKVLWNKYKILVPVFCAEDEFWIRISVHIYSRKEDYIRLRDAVLDMTKMEIRDLKEACDNVDSKLSKIDWNVSFT